MPRMYTDDEKDHAVEIARQCEGSLADAVRKLNAEQFADGQGVAKSTLRDWCIKAGVETGTDETRAQTKAAVAAAQLARKQKIDAGLDRSVELLNSIVQLSLAQQAELLRLNTKSLSEKEMSLIAPRDLVGMSTRAVHDLQLLLGEATERSETTGTREDILALRDKARATQERQLTLLQGGESA